MIILSQRDPQWAQFPLGASNLTVGRYGCTTTCISMVSDYFKGYKSPKDIAMHHDWYTKDGLILWGKLWLPTMKFDSRFYGRKDDVIKAALKHPDTAVILEVADRSHWVAALRPTLWGDSYIVADPWDAQKVDVIKRYRNITGGAVFSRR